MAEIYGLYSGRDGKVRYVGQTTGARDARFKEHQHCQTGRFVTAVYNWIQHEWLAGYPVKCALLERCSNEARHDLEREWISKFPNLLNERKKGFDWCHRKPPLSPKSEITWRDLSSTQQVFAPFTTGVDWIDTPFSFLQKRPCEMATEKEFALSARGKFL
jgi:hypothetical protein